MTSNIVRRFSARRFSGAVRRAAWTALAVVLVGPASARAASVTLQWTAPGDDGMTGRAQSYELRYSQTSVAGDTTGWWASATPVGSMPAPLPSGSREAFTIPGLQSNRTYYFVIRSTDDAFNVSGFSNVATKQTVIQGDVTLEIPANFTGSASSRGVSLTWTQGSPGGAERGFRLYRKGDGDPARALLTTLGLSAVSWYDSTVVAGTGYDYDLVAYSDSTEGIPASVRVQVPMPLAQATEIHGYPNPARDLVTFRVSLDATSTTPTKITVFDLTGHKICQLSDQVMSAGEHSITWPCRSDTGNTVAPGVYNIIVDGPSGKTSTQVAIIP